MSIAPTASAKIAPFVVRVTASNEPGLLGKTIQVDAALFIGRDPACSLTLNDSSVSRRHARIEPAPEGVRLVDLQSGNGVWIGTDKVTDVVVTPGQAFRIGSTMFECQGQAGEPTITVRILEGTDLTPAGQVFTLKKPTAVIGRQTDCDIVIKEPDVSRRHAALAIVDGQLNITDLDSSCGIAVDGVDTKSASVGANQKVRIGGTVIVEFRLAFGGAAEPEAAGPDPNATRLMSQEEFRSALGAAPVAAPPEAAPPAPPPAPPAVALPPVVPTSRPAPVETTGKIETPIAPAASTPPAAPPAPAAAASTPPAAPRAPRPAPEPAPPAQTAPAAPPAPPPAPAPKPAVAKSAAAAKPAPASKPAIAALEAEPSLDQTVVIQIPAELRQTEWKLDHEGDAFECSPYKPFLIDDPDAVWYVAAGEVYIFTVQVEKGEPVGAVNHFLGVLAGQIVCGFDLKQYNISSGFLVKVKNGTVLRRFTRKRFSDLATEPGRATLVGGLMDVWIAGLSSAIVASLDIKREGEVALRVGTAAQLTPGGRFTSASGVLWLQVPTNSVQFDGLSVPAFSRRSSYFPVCPHSWIEPIADEFDEQSIEPKATTELIRTADFWYAVGVFHQVIAEAQFFAKAMKVAEEKIRLVEKEEHRQRAAADAVGYVVNVLHDTPAEFRVQAEAEPVLNACKIVGQFLGIPVKQHPLANEEMSFEERMNSIASASNYRTRVVALRDNWYVGDNGPLIGQLAETKAPIALVPAGPAQYVAVDPKTGERVPVTPAYARTLSPFAYSFYRTFPEGALKVMDVVRFGARGLQADVRWVIFMAVVVGFFGTITPWITGQVFDSAIPGAQRDMLLGLGVAMLLSALATSAFKLTQGIATVRIQTKMSASIQAAVWDRILNLPVNFFRKYSAGDLTDRADGVGAIQDLIAGAGVAAVLGSISGLFYVVQMFGFNLRLALLAVLLTAIYVGTNMAANYLQLRHQRVEIQIRGRITGLVLNLLTGVTKLRVCGAENHALRVWAEQFARQRRITFSVGIIRNAAMVFGSVYPIVSSLAIFYVCTSVQVEAAEAGTAGLTTGDFIAFNSAYGLFLAAMQALGDASLSLLRVIPIYERLSPVLETPPEVDGSKQFPGKLTGKIELSNVFFRYIPDGPWIVKGISLKIEPGEFVAFVGSSGGGKSTLMRLMLGFENPTQGTVLYDGQDLAALDLRQVRQQIGVVLQASRVMPTEIYRNITGVTSRTIEDAWDAAEKAGLAEDIRNMPMGMHTYVSEGGGTLSGGQRQRMMIARAIVNKPKILFLDEATSALDNRTQSIVTESMARMDSSRIVIAHRLSTIADADRIYYLHGGEIAEVGTYKELMEKDGMFAQLAKRQLV